MEELWHVFNYVKWKILWNNYSFDLGDMELQQSLIPFALLSLEMNQNCHFLFIIL